MRCRLAFFTAALAVLPALPCRAQTWTRDASFNPILLDEISDLPNAAFVPAPDGRVLLYGSFTALENGALTARNLGYLRADGTVDHGFISSVRADESIGTAAPLPGGAVIAYRRDAENNGAIVRYRADGTLDPAFVPIDCPYQVHFAPLPDGRCLVWGNTLKFNGTFYNCVERLTAAGQIDPTFHAVATRGLADVLGLAVASDGRAYVSGTIASVEHGATPTPVMRLNADGSLDTGFTGPTPPQYSNVMAVQADGRLLVGTTAGVARYNPDGTLDQSFTAAIPEQRGIARVVSTADGKVIVDALVGTGNGPWPHAVFLLTPSGAVLRDLRSLFEPGHTRQLKAVQADGSLFVTDGLPQAVFEAPPPGVIDFAPWPPPAVVPFNPVLARVSADGNGAAVIDPGIRRTLPGDLSYLHIQPDSRVLVSGPFTSVNGEPRERIARFTAAGALDPTFVPAAAAANLISIRLFAPDGGVLGWGYVLGDQGADGNYRLDKQQFIRLRGDGSLDTAFALNSDYTGPEIAWHAIAADGRILVSYFVPDASQEQNLRLEWLTASGRLQLVLPTRFSGLPRAVLFPGGGTTSPGFANPFRFAQPLADGRVLVGGMFQKVNNADTPWLVRLNADGSVDTTYVPDLREASDAITPYAADASGRVLFAGQTTQSGQPVWIRFRLLANGQRDPTYGYDGPPLKFAETLTADNGLPDLNFPPAGTVTRPGDTLYGQCAPDGTAWSTQPFARFTAMDVATITVPPADQTVTAGFDTVFLVGIGSRHPATYQWLFNDAPIAGATHQYLSLFAVTADQAGAYRVRVTIDGQTQTSTAAHLTVRGGAARVVNFSARARAGTAPLIAGFSISDGTPRAWLLRATGPSLSLLAAIGMNRSLPDPALRLFRGPTEIAYDQGSILASEVTEFARKVGAFQPYGAPVWFPEWRSKESALIPTLSSSSYTAHVTSPTGADGVALFELYDAYPDGASGAVDNLSLRARTGSGENIATLGFVVAGNAPLNVLVRGLGPALRGFGVGGAITDPQLAVYHGSNHALATNAGWADDAAIAEAARSAHAFPLAAGSNDAALLLRLEPGAYTVQLSSLSGATGEGLIEVYVIAP